MRGIRIFRWFKFTFVPPYNVAHENFLLAIGTLPIGIFLLNLDSRHLETWPMTSGHTSKHFWVLGP